MFNGDVIIPKKGKSLKLIYAYECGTLYMIKREVVKCDAANEKSGWFKSLFEEVVVRSKVRRYDIDEAKVMGTKGKTGEENLCFPEERFRLSPWPADGTTVLYGEAIFFRWEDVYEKISPCAESTLIIIGPDGKEIAKPMKTGELLSVSGKVFRENTVYEWCVKADGKKVSGDYRFHILDKAESDNIRKLAGIPEKHANQTPAQALYLQLLSDTTPKLDLYADSLRIMKGYKKPCQTELPPIADEVFRRIFEH
ncbi:MAG: hypothetical protein B6245_08960 [Desulfobacteraceae bacterium 4572_88]|nr:MAG: hypothetical protein B6245_08960 [Desulfobacteraceae bacterium 4572_88]